MHEIKDTARALVRISFEGLVHKTYRGHQARERFDNEVLVLRHLAEKGCNFVPQLIEADPTAPKIITTNCGSRVEQIRPERLKELFAELNQFGVRHDDPFARNVTYRVSDGRFCIIDFEFATIFDADGRQLNDPPRISTTATE